MENFFSVNPAHVRLLVVADVDVASASLIAEHFVPQSPRFDAIVIMGPFTHEEAKTEEELVISKGEMGAVIAQFENIVCRVIYLGSERDPVSTLAEQLHLTPNSVNVHARHLPLAEGLFMIGFAETDENLVTSPLPPDVDRSPESDDELEGVQVQAGVSSIAAIQGLLQSAATDDASAGGSAGHKSIFQRAAAAAATTTTTTAAAAASPAEAPSSAPPASDDAGSAAPRGAGPDTSSGDPAPAARLGLFAFNYKYAHTLNHFLFHMPETLAAASVKLCLLPPSAETGEPARLPKTFGSLSIAALGSLRQRGCYSVVELARGEGGAWAPQAIELHALPDGPGLAR